MSQRINEGYDYQLVNGTPPDECICLICHLLARDAHQANCCGKIFCRNCLVSHQKQSLKFNCPNCREPLAGKLFKDTKTDRDICHLQIYCTNKNEGCSRQGNLKDIDKHIKQCPNQEVTCDKCKNNMQRQQLQNHVENKCLKRDFKCVHCQIVGKYDFITGRHQEECPNIVLPCENDGCLQKVKRCKMGEHRQTCPKEIVKCPYYDIGCHTEMTREDIDQHEENNTKIHLKKAVEKINNKSCPVLIKLTDFSNHKRLQDEWYSSGFYTSSGGYKIRLNVDANGYGNAKDTHTSCFINLMPGENDDMLEWPFQGKFTIELLNQREDENHRSAEITFDATTEEKFGGRKTKQDESGYGIHLFIPHTNLGFNPSTNTQYLMNDSLYFRVSVDVQSKTKPWLAGAI